MGGDEAGVGTENKIFHQVEEVVYDYPVQSQLDNSYSSATLWHCLRAVLVV